MTFTLNDLNAQLLAYVLIYGKEPMNVQQNILCSTEERKSHRFGAT